MEMSIIAHPLCTVLVLIDADFLTCTDRIYDQPGGQTLHDDKTSKNKDGTKTTILLLCDLTAT